MLIENLASTETPCTINVLHMSVMCNVTKFVLFHKRVESANELKKSISCSKHIQAGKGKDLSSKASRGSRGSQLPACTRRFRLEHSKTCKIGPKTPWETPCPKETWHNKYCNKNSRYFSLEWWNLGTVASSASTRFGGESGECLSVMRSLLSAPSCS